MTFKPAFIGSDWGTSNARFMLVGADGGLIEQRTGPGIAQIDGAVAAENICFDVIGEWISEHPSLPVLMAGMVGSNIGWRTAGYCDTPATLADVTAGTLKFQARGSEFRIAPGLATVRKDGLPDVMRGEEMQIFGIETGDGALVCLPGTHSKWAKVERGAVTEFHTAPTGELLDILGRHSILLNPKRPVMAVTCAEFLEGVSVARDAAAGLESLLFTVRSRQITQSLNAVSADSYLAGLAIGCEIKSALALYGPIAEPIHLVGSPQLTTLYANALSLFALRAVETDGNYASLCGLAKFFTELQ